MERRNVAEEIPNPKLQIPNKLKIDATRSKPYDLEERTYQFAQGCRAFVKKLSRTIANMEDARQLVRSSGSVAANYIEANESVSKKDFALRVKIARKEAKESRLWLRLIEANAGLQMEQKTLMAEAAELCKIFTSILRRSRI